MFNSLWLHVLQHVSFLCPLSPRVCSDSCLLSRWSCLTISSSAVPFSFCLQSFPASGSFSVSPLWVTGNIGVSTSVSVLPMNVQGGFSLGTDLISLCVYLYLFLAVYLYVSLCVYIVIIYLFSCLMLAPWRHIHY